LLRTYTIPAPAIKHLSSIYRLKPRHSTRIFHQERTPGTNTGNSIYRRTVSNHPMLGPGNPGYDGDDKEVITMATSTTHMSVEEYLHGDHDWDIEPDYVDGELEERYLGQKDHSRWQRAILLFFANHPEWHFNALPELRTQTKRTSYRTPDVLVLGPDAPDEQIITHPPLAVFEVLSPDDRISCTQRKLAEYEAMGVPSIYLIDTDTRTFQRYQAGALLPVTECTVGGFTFPCAEIAKLVP